MPDTAPLIAVRGLRVGIRQANAAPIPVIDDLDFSIDAGETFALVGESGCGKSLTALALMRLLPPGIHIQSGEIFLRGRELLALPEASMRKLRGGDMAMIFQEPATSLNPVLTIERQIGEALALHLNLGRRECRERAKELLAQVGIGDPARRLAEYPFQLSGGMKQRVMIAIALAARPRLLIADEPSTALDVTVQAQMLDLLQKLQDEYGMALLLITHDLGVVARMADQVGVMYAGQLVERARRDVFFRAPRHPYSHALFAALPETARHGQRLSALPGQAPAFTALSCARGCRFAARCALAEEKPCREQAPALKEQDSGVWARCHFQGAADKGRTPGDGRRATRDDESLSAPLAPPVAELLRVRGLRVHFPVRKGLLQRTHGFVRAVDGVDLELTPGRTLALVGESGCGKTTVGRALMRIIPMTDGEIFWQGKRVNPRDKNEARRLRQAMQMVFQDPYASLNPRMNAGEILREGMLALKAARSEKEARERCAALLSQVGLKAEHASRYPHEFSGGQRQRIAIARALAVSPRVMLCDEPTSALDVSVQAQILNLMQDLQAELGIAYLFITHNFAVVEYLAHEIAVMYLGRIVESGPAAAVLAAPAHPYTRALLSAVPRIEGDREIIRLEGEPPSPANPPPGCGFCPRCPQAMPICREACPPMIAIGMGRMAACWDQETNQGQGDPRSAPRPLPSVPDQWKVMGRAAASTQ
ncbi:MAG: ABC transporter ATP-binding protein [Zoogloeaceae bacterium]|jgi:peptide/nickel transport system ATP-binding protein|nr:ABC transporter ATP-binding protein [Zoogloeaceae bacterium]